MINQNHRDHGQLWLHLLSKKDHMVYILQTCLARLSIVVNLVHQDFRLFKPLKEIDEPKTEVKSDLKPEWVSRLSTEFKAEISEVENFKKPQQKEIPVSPLMAERRNNSKGNKSAESPF